MPSPHRILLEKNSENKSKKYIVLTIDNLIQVKLKILFVSPEKLRSAAFYHLLQPKYDIESETYMIQSPPV